MSLKADSVASYLGQGWAALMGLAFVPLYVQVLGFETYGLIGAFAVLQAWIALLDFGLTPTLTREMARHRAGACAPEFVRDLVRSLEVVYLGLASLSIALLWFGAGPIARDWLHLERMDPQLVISALHIMAFVLATRWLEQVYRGALQGMQDQIWLNLAQAILATLRWGGSYAVIRWVAPSVILFFLWQGFVSVLTIAVFVRRTYRLLPDIRRGARFDPSVLRRVFRFASGMFLGTLLSLLLTQGDKLIISKLLPLAEFGAYMLAATAAMGLLQLILPMNAVIYPHLTRLATTGDDAALVAAYHRACEWLSAIIVPPALVLAFFAMPVLYAWTGDAVLADRVAPLLSILVLGTLCNGLMNLPYMAQLAHGWTSLSVRINVVAVLVLAPAVLWAVPRYGSVGAAWAWLSLNVAYLLVSAHLMHARLLKGEKLRWYVDSITRPVVACAAATAFLRFVVPIPSSRLQASAMTAAAVAVAMASAATALPRVRRSAIEAIQHARMRTRS